MTEKDPFFCPSGCCDVCGAENFVSERGHSDFVSTSDQDVSGLEPDPTAPTFDEPGYPRFNRLVWNKYNCRFKRPGTRFVERVLGRIHGRDRIEAVKYLAAAVHQNPSGEYHVHCLINVKKPIFWRRPQDWLTDGANHVGVQYWNSKRDTYKHYLNAHLNYLARKPAVGRYLTKFNLDKQDHVVDKSTARDLFGLRMGK